VVVGDAVVVVSEKLVHPLLKKHRQGCLCYIARSGVDSGTDSWKG
jgi:hypothetical protein